MKQNYEVWRSICLQFKKNLRSKITLKWHLDGGYWFLSHWEMSKEMQRASWILVGFHFSTYILIKWTLSFGDYHLNCTCIICAVSVWYVKLQWYIYIYWCQVPKKPETRLIQYLWLLLATLTRHPYPKPLQPRSLSSLPPASDSWPRGFLLSWQGLSAPNCL